MSIVASFATYSSQPYHPWMLYPTDSNTEKDSPASPSFGITNGAYSEVQAGLPASTSTHSAPSVPNPGLGWVAHASVPSTVAKENVTGLWPISATIDLDWAELTNLPYPCTNGERALGQYDLPRVPSLDSYASSSPSPEATMKEVPVSSVRCSADSVDGRFRCGKCPKRYTAKHNLLSHVNLKHLKKKKPFQCEFCGKEFTGSRAQVRHMENRKACPNSTRVR